MRGLSQILSLNLILGSVLNTSLVQGAESAEPQKERSIKQGAIFVQAACTVCHSNMMIQAARKDRQDWEQTLAKMEKQGMQPLPASIKAKILEFLSHEQGREKQSQPKSSLPWGSAANANPLWPL